MKEKVKIFFPWLANRQLEELFQNKIDFSQVSVTF